MQFDVKHFLLLNAAIVGIVAVSIYFRAKGAQKGPTKLDMGWTGKGMQQTQNERKEREGRKPLNVIFVYNGHSWDAFEVLGLPAGSPMSAVEQAYSRALDENDIAAHDFIGKAYNAIKES